MARLKRETVSVSFHYLTRIVDVGLATEHFVPFSQVEFTQLSLNLRSKPVLDIRDVTIADQLRFRDEIPLEKIVEIDNRTVFGIFKASYSGHVYENNVRGQIPAESVSLRPFHFLLYFSESGRIYVGTQYLGQFGGYEAFRSALFKSLPDKKGVFSRTFRQGGVDVSKVQAKEVQVELLSRSSSIASSNVFTKSGMVIFRKRDKDDGFEGQVTKGILSPLGRARGDIKTEIAKILSQGQLIDVKDEDIEDYIVVASVNGRKKNIYMLEDGNFATKFPMNVSLGADGHPPYSQTRDAMVKVLSDEIIASAENV